MTEPNPIPPSEPTPPSPASGLFAVPYAPAELAPQEQRTLGMLCHLLALSGFVGVPLGNVLGPLIIWLIKKDEVPFVNDQGKEALNFQITVLILAVVISPLVCLAGIGVLLLIPLGIAALVFTIIGTIKASGGTYYRYPFAARLIK